MAEEKNKVIKEAKKEVEYLTGDEEVQRLAELREKWEMDRNSEIGQAKKEGIEEGKAEGKEEGKAEGKKEEKLEIAQNMLKDGMNLEIVMKYTGLTKEEVLNLKENS